MTADEFTSDLAPCYGDALRYCRALCVAWSPSEAEDILQEALLRAFKSYKSLEDRTKFRPWLFKIITRVFQSASRRAYWKRLVPLEARYADAHFPAVYQDLDYMNGHPELFRALSELRVKDRAAILLFEVGGFSIQEIVSIQGERSQSAVKSRLSRARSRLRRLLSQSPQPEASTRSEAATTTIERLTYEAISAANNNRAV